MWTSKPNREGYAALQPQMSLSRFPTDVKSTLPTPNSFSTTSLATKSTSTLSFSTDSTVPMQALHIVMGIFLLGITFLSVFAAFTITNDSVYTVPSLHWFAIYLTFAILFGGLTLGYGLYLGLNKSSLTRTDVRMRAFKAVICNFFITAFFIVYTLIGYYMYSLDSASLLYQILRLRSPIVRLA